MASTMLLAMVKIYPRPGHEHDIVDVLESLKEPTAISSDCLGCMIAVEPGQGGAICYIEQWRTRAALDQHLRSPWYDRVLAAMELSCSPPMVEFYEINEVGRLDIIEKVRMVS